MNTYIVLLRGINVGGNNILPMKELKAALTAQGFENVKTYIQSGNIVLSSAVPSKDEISTKVSALIENQFGFTPNIMVLTVDELSKAMSNNPYPEHDGKLVHFYICNTQPKLDKERLTTLQHETEETTLMDKVFYLHAPNGIGRSKLVAKIESCLGVSATGRNLNTMNKLVGMVG